jgi:integrase
MATIVTRKGRPKPYLAQIHRKGHPTFSKSFSTMAAARRWATEQERKLELAGLPLTIAELQKTTVGDLAERYRDAVASERPDAESDLIVLRSLLKRPLARKSLAVLSTQDGAEYRDQRLKETWRGKPIKPSTIRREANVLQAMFERARLEWGFADLVNPFRGLRVKGATRRRKYCPTPQECAQLNKAAQSCRDSNRFYIPLSITIATDTGMRLQEILNLEWDDLDFEHRRIRIRKSKTDYRTGLEGRTIVMPKKTHDLLSLLKTTYGGHALVRFAPATSTCISPTGQVRVTHTKRATPILRKTSRLFPMTKSAFKQARRDVWVRAGFSHFTFHDLRHSAASRFSDAHLAPHEHDHMMGRSPRNASEGYIHATLRTIQEKLDAYDRAQHKKEMDAVDAEIRERRKQRFELTLKYPDGEASPGFSDLSAAQQRDVRRTLEEFGIWAEKKKRETARLARLSKRKTGGPAAAA